MDLFLALSCALTIRERQAPDMRLQFHPRSRQIAGLKPRHLSSKGQELLALLQDAETCIPKSFGLDQLEVRARVYVSDLLRCASEPNTEAVCDAASEFARNSPEHGYWMLIDLDPLIFPCSEPRTGWRLLPWTKRGKGLVPRQYWGHHPPDGWTGLPLHFRVLEQPVPPSRRTDIRAFTSQITNESSHWHQSAP